MTNATLPPCIKFQPIVGGLPIPGGKVKFYLAGTSTPQAVYADDGTTPIGTEVTLDANGSTDFRLDPDVTYKVELYDADDALVDGWPIDNVLGGVVDARRVQFTYANTYGAGTIGKWIQDLATGTGATFLGWLSPLTGAVVQTLAQIFDDLHVSVKWFGADATGVADSTTAFQAALTACAGRTMRVPKGTYKLTATVTGSASNTSVICDAGAVFNCTGMADGTPVFQFLGTKTSLSNLTSAATKDATSVACTAGTVGSLSTNDWVKLDTDELFNITRTNYYKGEIQKVSSADNGTGVVTLLGPLFDSYTITGKTPTLSKITPVLNIRWTGGEFLFDIAKLQNCLSFQYCGDVVLRGATLKKCMNAGVEFNNCCDWIVTNCHIEDSRDTTVATGYAITSNGSQYGLVTSNTFFRNRHDYTDNVAGVSRFNRIENNTSYDSVGYAISPHGCSEWISVVNNTVVGAIGIQSRGHNSTWEGNEIISAATYGFQVSEEGHFGLVFRNNKISMRAGSNAAIGIDTGTGTGLPNVGYDVNISGNHILCNGVGVGMSIGPINRLKVSDNYIYHTNGDGIRPVDCSDVSITGNYIKKSASGSKYAISLTGTGSGYYIDGNHMVESWAAGIRVGVATTTKVKLGVNYADSTIDVLSCASDAVAAATLINNGGWKYYAQTPTLPVGTGAGNLVTNKFGVPYAIHHTGGVGLRVITAGGTARAITGDQSPFFLNNGDSIYFLTTVPSAWTWYGIGI